MQMILQELRYGLRQMRKSPVFTAVAVLTLALGHRRQYRHLHAARPGVDSQFAGSHPEQLVRLRFTGDTPGHFNSYGGEDKDYFSYPMYRDLRDKNQVFQSLIANDQQNVAVQWNEKPDLAGCELVSGNYFEVLGSGPRLAA